MERNSIMLKLSFPIILASSCKLEHDSSRIKFSIVAYPCNSSYSRGIDRRTVSSRLAQANGKSRVSGLKKRWRGWGEGHNSTVQQA
jgi:hypothetical protein